MKEKIETAFCIILFIVVISIFCIKFAEPVDSYYISSENENGIHYIYVEEECK